MVEKNTKQRIQDYLRKHQLATTEELSIAFGMTKANVLYHLQDLEERQIIEVFQPPNNAKQGKGRPSNFYRLSSHSAPGNLDHLLSALFQAYFKSMPQGKNSDTIYQSIAKEMFPKVEYPPKTPLSKKINHAVLQINQYSYDACWEAHKEGPHIIFHNCPYRVVREQIPDICEVDKAILFHLLGDEITKIDQIKSSQVICRFAITI